MSAPSVVQKGCNLDLSLAGSRVAIVHAFKYTSGKPQHGPSSPKDAIHSPLESKPWLRGENVVLSGFTCGNIRNGSPAGVYPSIGVDTRLKQSQLPSFRIGNGKCLGANVVTDCDQRGNGVIQHRLKYTSKTSSHSNYNFNHLTHTSLINGINVAGNKQLASVSCTATHKSKPVSDSAQLHQHSDATTPVPHTEFTPQRLQNDSSSENIASSASTTLSYHSGHATPFSDVMTPHSGRDTPQCIDPIGEVVTSNISTPQDSGPVLDMGIKLKKKDKKKKKRVIRGNKAKVGSSHRQKHISHSRPMSHQSNAEKIGEDGSSKLGFIQAMCKPVSVLTSPPRVPKPKLLYTKPGLGDNGSKHQIAIKSIVSRSQRLSVPHSTMDLTARSLESPTQMVSVLKRGSKENATNRSFGGREEDIVRLTKVYLSERQSGMQKEMGLEFPCAPPATPMPVLLQRYEYIPSLNDIRSQRAVKLKLEAMEKAEMKKQEQAREERIKQEKINQKERHKEHRKQQRLEIYALNKIMTELEHRNFQEFCKRNGINCKL